MATDSRAGTPRRGHRRLPALSRIAVWLTIVGSAASMLLTPILLTAQRRQDGSGSKKARAISSVVSPPSIRYVSAARASAASTG